MAAIGEQASEQAHSHNSRARSGSAPYAEILLLRCWPRTLTDTKIPKRKQHDRYRAGADLRVLYLITHTRYSE